MSQHCGGLSITLEFWNINFKVHLDPWNLVWVILFVCFEYIFFLGYISTLSKEDSS